MLSRETRFTETRPIAAWSLVGVAGAVMAAMEAAQAAGAPEVPERVHLQVSPPIGAGKGSLYTLVAWGSALENNDAGN